MHLTLGNAGARLIALGIAVSTLGFLSQSVLTAPRVYFAMASDGLFFRAVARVNAKTHVPVLAIVMQSVLTLVIALSGSYEKILNYVVSIDFIFFGLTGVSLFVFRRRDGAAGGGISRAGASVDDGALRGSVLAGGDQYDLSSTRRTRRWDWGFWRWACRYITGGRDKGKLSVIDRKCRK